MNALMDRIVPQPRDSSLSPYRRRVPEVPEVREVHPDEYTVAGEVTALAYVEFADSASPEWGDYLKRIADIAGRARRTTVLVAVAGDRVLGSATLELRDQLEPPWTAPVGGGGRPVAGQRHAGADGPHRVHMDGAGGSRRGASAHARRGPRSAPERHRAAGGQGVHRRCRG